MTDELLEPLDDELKSLFSAEARFPEAASAAQARVWQGVATALALPPVPSDAALTHTATAAKVSALSASAGLTKLVTVGVVTFALGGVSGAALYRAVVEPPLPVVIEVPVPQPAPSIEPSVRSSDAGEADAALPSAREPAPQTAERPRFKPAPAVDEPTTQSELARERAIIDVVRAAIARGHTDSALEAVARHEREFPHGRLREEREGLRILTLVRAGRVDQAKGAALRFKQEYPKSVLWPAIDSALQDAR
jgi:hypothetical protein